MKRSEVSAEAEIKRGGLRPLWSLKRLTWRVFKDRCWGIDVQTCEQWHCMQTTDMFYSSAALQGWTYFIIHGQWELCGWWLRRGVFQAGQRKVSVLKLKWNKVSPAALTWCLIYFCLCNNYLVYSLCVSEVNHLFFSHKWPKYLNYVYIIICYFFILHKDLRSMCWTDN